MAPTKKKFAHKNLYFFGLHFLENQLFCGTD